MKTETAGKIKYGVWGLIVGAVLVMIIGFGWGGWSTLGTTKTMTKEALLATRSAICVAQFMKQPNHQEKLKEFAAYTSWNRAEFIEKVKKMMGHDIRFDGHVKKVTDNLPKKNINLILKLVEECKNGTQRPEPCKNFKNLIAFI